MTIKKKFLLCRLLAGCLALLLMPQSASSAASSGEVKPGASGVFGTHGEFIVESTGTLDGISCEGTALAVENTKDTITLSTTGDSDNPVEGNIALSPGDTGKVSLVLSDVYVIGIANSVGAMELSSGVADITLEGGKVEALDVAITGGIKAERVAISGGNAVTGGVKVNGVTIDGGNIDADSISPHPVNKDGRYVYLNDLSFGKRRKFSEKMMAKEQR
jgi:hypothetical protein